MTKEIMLSKELRENIVKELIDKRIVENIGKKVYFHNHKMKQEYFIENQMKRLITNVTGYPP